MGISDTVINELIRALQENTAVENKSLNRIKNAAVKESVQRAIGLGNRLKSLPGRAAGAAARGLGGAVSGVASGAAGLVSGAAGFAASEARAIGGIARRGAGAGLSIAAAASDPRDVTGVGSSQALNNILDSIAGQAGGSLIRNVAGLSEIQGVQQSVESIVQATVSRNADAGLKTTDAEVINAAKLARKNAELKQSELKRVNGVLEKEGLLKGFSTEEQLKKVYDNFVKGLDEAGKALGKFRRTGRI